MAGTVLTLGPVWVIPTLSTGGSVLQALCTQPLFMRGRMLLQTHDAIMLNIVALLQHLLSFDMHLLCFLKKMTTGVIKERRALVSYTKRIYMLIG